MDWNATHFIWLDWTVLAIGICGVVAAVWYAIWKDKKAQQGEDSSAYLFGKGEPWYVIGMAIFAANIGSEHLVGLAGTGAKSGVGMAHWEMQGWMILILEVPLHTAHRFMAFYHHTGGLRANQGFCYCPDWWYLLQVSLGTEFLGWRYRTDSHHSRIHRIRRYEGCNDTELYPDTYSYYRFVPRVVPWSVCTWWRQHC